MRLLIILTSAMFFALTSLGNEKLSETVFFTVNSAELSPESKQKINDLFPLPKDMIIDKITVVGHADKLGDESTNLQLSAKRARSVFSYMQENHLDMIIYDVDFVGEANPVFDEDELNRCVTIEIELLPKIKETPPQDVVEELFPEEFPPKQNEPKVEETRHLASAGFGMSNEEEDSYIPKTIKKRDKFQIQNIHFYGNRADYTRASEKSLKQLLDFMKKYPKVQIMLEGHVNGKRVRKRDLKEAAERSGGKFYRTAEELSLGRAESVKSYLVKNGIEPERIETVGKGGNEMIYKNPRTHSQSEANRRIEIIILED